MRCRGRPVRPGSRQRSVHRGPSVARGSRRQARSGQPPRVSEYSDAKAPCNNALAIDAKGPGRVSSCSSTQGARCRQPVRADTHRKLTAMERKVPEWGLGGTAWPAGPAGKSGRSASGGEGDARAVRAQDCGRRLPVLGETEGDHQPLTFRSTATTRWVSWVGGGGGERRANARPTAHADFGVTAKRHVRRRRLEADVTPPPGARRGDLRVRKPSSESTRTKVITPE